MVINCHQKDASRQVVEAGSAQQNHGISRRTRASYYQKYLRALAVLARLPTAHQHTARRFHAVVLGAVAHLRSRLLVDQALVDAPGQAALFPPHQVVHV